MTKEKYSKKYIHHIKQEARPRVLLNVCTHGDEKVGLKVADFFRNLKVRQGTFIINIANEEAVKNNSRFIQEDLNRVFPGKKNGSLEAKLAYKMRPFINAFDVVMDVHSTKTGMDSSVIVTEINKKVKSLIECIGPKRALIMRATKSNALISEARIGIAFEYGTDTSKKTYMDTVISVKRVLAYLNMLPTRPERKLSKITTYYDVTSSINKPEGFIVSKSVKNFVLVKKGSVIGNHSKTGKPLYATFDFYPILFGKNSYTKIFGFCAKKKADTL